MFDLLIQPPIYYIIVILLGLVVGSFLNVVIIRLPNMMKAQWRSQCTELMELKQDEKPYQDNLVHPRSHCPHCNHLIYAWDNIPVLSYILLKGQCRQCQQPISIRYPIIELVSALSALLVALKFGVSTQALFGILFSWVLIVLTMIDYDHQLLPDDIVLPMLWLGIIISFFNIYTDLQNSVIGAILGYLILWSVYIIFKLVTHKEGMGHGDFKLLAMIGAWFGWQSLLLIIIISSLVGSVVGIMLICLKSMDNQNPIAFGPYLALAAWIYLFYGEKLIAMYIAWNMPI